VKRAAAAIASCLVLVGCGGGSDSARPSPQPSTASRLTCANSDGGTCRGNLEPGTYTTSSLVPGLTYTVPAGWSNEEDLAINFLLLPPGGVLSGVNDGTSDYLGVYPAVVAPGHCTGMPSKTAPQAFEGLVHWLKADTSLTVSGIHDITVGGLSGISLDVAMRNKKGDGCPDGAYADFFTSKSLAGMDGSTPVYVVQGVAPGDRARLYLLRHGSDVLAIEVADGTEGVAGWLDAADAVVQSFHFAAT
jgi:hypothetical protein